MRRRFDGQRRGLDARGLSPPDIPPVDGPVKADRRSGIARRPLRSREGRRDRRDRKNATAAGAQYAIGGARRAGVIDANRVAKRRQLDAGTGLRCIRIS